MERPGEWLIAKINLILSASKQDANLKYPSGKWIQLNSQPQETIEIPYVKFMHSNHGAHMASNMNSQNRPLSKNVFSSLFRNNSK